MTQGEVLYRPPTERRHECAPPMRCAVYEFDAEWPRFVRWRECTGFHDGYGCINGEAAEPIGTVWRCGDCGRYWVVYLPENHPESRMIVAYVPVWRRATWLQRRRARRAARVGVRS